jgi:hypothetical protein
MSDRLKQAQEYLRAGQDKKAVGALWEVPLTDSSSAEEAHALLDLATALRDRTEGSLRSDCEFQIRRARQALEVSSQTVAPMDEGIGGWWSMSHRERFRHEVRILPFFVVGALAFVWVINRPRSVFEFLAIFLSMMAVYGAFMVYNYLRMRSDDAQSEQGESQP